MQAAKDGRGVESVMGYLRPGQPAKQRLTATQVKWFSNLIGSWLVYGVGLSVGEAAKVLSRRITENRLRTVVHGMTPISALPDPNGFAGGWRFLLSPPGRAAVKRDKRPRPRHKPRPPLPKRAPAGRGATTTVRARTSTIG